MNLRTAEWLGPLALVLVVAGFFLRRRIFDPLRTLLGNVLSLVDEVIDWWYFRWDLWATPPSYRDAGDHIDYSRKLTRGTADHAKVRGHLFALVACGVLIYLAVRTNTPAQVYRDVLAIMLVFSMGERVAIAIAKAWGSRKVADAPIAGVASHDVESRRAQAGGDHEVTP